MGSAKLISLLQKHEYRFYPVVAFDAGNDKLIQFDLTASNSELSEKILSDTNSFIVYVNDQLRKNNARYGIGGYAENRDV